MKKRILLVLLCLSLVLTACMAACNKPEETKPTTPPTTAAPTTQKPTEAPTTQKPTEAPTTQKPTEPEVKPTEPEVKPTEPEVEPTEPEVKPTEPVKPKPAETAIGSNPDYPNLPQKLVIVEQLLFGDTTENIEQRQLWVDTLSARYGVEIVLDVLPKATTGEILQTRLAAGELTGMVYCYSDSMTLDWIAADAIYPLDDFLKNNATWNKLPEAMRQSHMVGGQIWEVPNRWNSLGSPDQCAFSSQALRADWMAKLGLEKTGTTMDVATFKSYIKAFGDRADELGVTGKVIPAIFTGTVGINGIFSAFDASFLFYWDYQGYSYNPETNCQEDSLLRPGARDAILYVRDLYLGGYCPKSTFDTGSNADIRAILATGRVGSFCMYSGAYRDGGSTVNLVADRIYGHHNWNKIGDGYTAWAELQEATWYDFMLTGTKTKNLFASTTSSGGWCLFKGTEQPEETVNFLVDFLYSSDTTFFDGKYNLLGTAYIKEADGTYTRQIFDDTTDPVTYYVNTNLIGDFISGLYPAADYDVYDLGVDKSITFGQRRARRAYYNTLNVSAVQEGRLITLPPAYKTAMNNSGTYARYMSDIDTYMTEFIYGGIMKDIDINKQFEEYKKGMRLCSGDQILKEVNDAMGWNVNDYQSYAAG